MTLTLVGYPISICTRRVKVVAAELGIDDLAFRAVDFKAGEHKTPEFLEKQPFGQVPYLVDADVDLVVYESRAICRYLALKCGTLPTDPTDLKAVALFEQGASCEVSNFDCYAGAIFEEVVVRPRMGLKTDEAILQRAHDNLVGKLEGYERVLGKQGYVAGHELTIVDLFHLPLGEVVEGLYPDIFTKHPNVSRWWTELKARPSWVKAKELGAPA